MQEVETWGNQEFKTILSSVSEPQNTLCYIELCLKIRKNEGTREKREGRKEGGRTRVLMLRKETGEI